MMRNGLLLSTRSLLAMGMLMWATRLIAGFGAVGLAGALPPALTAERAHLQPAHGAGRQAEVLQLLTGRICWFLCSMQPMRSCARSGYSGALQSAAFWC
jgi:hypothetical protein